MIISHNFMFVCHVNIGQNTTATES